MLCAKTIEICSKYLKELIEEINETKRCCNKIFDFSKLKYRERDQLIERLEFWIKLCKDNKYL